MEILEFQTVLNGLFILPLSYFLMYCWKHTRFVKASARGIDPVGEAEVFLFQGKTKQAIRVLRAELADNPNNMSAKIALLRAFSDAVRPREYHQLASEVEHHLQHEPIWQQIKRAGRHLEPEDPLYR